LEPLEERCQPSLGAPQPLSPLGAIMNTTPTLSWSALPDAVSYALKVDDVSAKGIQVQHASHISGTSWVASAPLILGHTYKWFVRAQGMHGTSGPWSAPAGFTLVSPFSGSYTGAFNGNITIHGMGQVVNGNIAFTVGSSGKISISAPGRGEGAVDLFGNLGVTGSATVIVSGKRCSYTFAGLEVISSGTASVSGLWHASFKGGVASGIWTAQSSKLTGAPLDSPTLLMPDGAITNREPALTWTPVNGASYYHVTLTDTTAKKQVLDTHVSGTVLSGNVFRLGHSYQWGVQAVGTNNIPGGFSAAHFLVTSPSVARSTLSVSATTTQASDTVLVTLRVRDAARHNITDGGLAVVFGLGAGANIGTFTSVVDHGDGTYTSTLSLTTAGENSITATINGRAVTSSLPTITANPGPVSLSQSLVSVSTASIQSGNTATVELIAKDAYGNQESSGGLPVVFGLGTGSASGTFNTFADNNNGTYTGVFTGTTAGSNTITATINSQLVASNPAIMVMPGPVSLSQSVVLLSNSTITFNGTATVTLQTKDANGNNLTGGGLTVTFGLSGSGTGTFAPAHPTDNLNGTYTATFTPTTGGTDTFTATIGGQLVTSAAPALTVTALDNVTVTGPVGSTPTWAPTFSLNAVANATSYEFKLDDLTSGAQVFDQNVAGTSFDPFTDVVSFTAIPATSSMSAVTLTYNGYSASLATTDSNGNLAVTAAQLQASLNTLPDLTGNVSVLGNENGPFTVVFANGLDPFQLTSGAYARVVSSTPLTQGDQYRWYVRALSADNSSPWSQADFNIPASPYAGTYKGTYSGYINSASFPDQVVDGTIVLTVDNAGYISTSQPGTDGRGTDLNNNPVAIDPEGLLRVYNGTSDVGGPLAGAPVNSSIIGGDGSITGVAGGIIGTAVFVPGGNTQTYLFAGAGRDDISIGATFRDIQFGPSGTSGVWIATAAGGTAPPDMLDSSGFNPIINVWSVRRQ
jgi:hypothetical protein